MHEDVAMQPSFFAIASTILRITHFFSSRPRRLVFVPIITIVAQLSKTTKTSYSEIHEVKSRLVEIAGIG
jgi:hypothetical protein